MTNAEIILDQRLNLMKEGVLKGTGRFFTYKVINGETGAEEERTLEEPEVIHTFSAWKELGYCVKKGEHAKASFTIWKYAECKKNDEEDGEQKEGRCFLKKAHFFTIDQVEKLPA